MNMNGQSPAPGSGHQLGGSGSIPALVNGLLSGGHQTDMSHLWQVVQQLSDLLQENRVQSASIVNSLHQIHAHDGSPSLAAHINGDHDVAQRQKAQQQQQQQQQQQEHEQHEEEHDLNSLRTQLQSALASVSTLNEQNGALRTLLQDYETSLVLVLEKLRPYAHQQHDALVALHAYYGILLERERQQSLEQRLEHQQWQAGLGRVADYARRALKESADAGLGHQRQLRELRAEISELRTENRILSRTAHANSTSDSDED